MIQQDDFLKHQLSFPRVQAAKQQTDLTLKKILKETTLHYPAKQLHIRAFKQEQLLEVWASDHDKFQFIKTYEFTAKLGRPGPKQKEGDFQIPEGLLA